MNLNGNKGNKGIIGAGIKVLVHLTLDESKNKGTVTLGQDINGNKGTQGQMSLEKKIFGVRLHMFGAQSLCMKGRCCMGHSKESLKYYPKHLHSRPSPTASPLESH